MALKVVFLSNGPRRLQDIAVVREANGEKATRKLANMLQEQVKAVGDMPPPWIVKEMEAFRLYKVKHGGAAAEGAGRGRTSWCMIVWCTCSCSRRPQGDI